jgi:hypothetical protein
MAIAMIIINTNRTIDTQDHHIKKGKIPAMYALWKKEN